MKQLKAIALWLYRIILYPIIDNPIFFLYTFFINEELMIFSNIYAGYLNWFLGTLLPLFDGYIFCILASILKRIRMRGLVWAVYTAITLGETFSLFCYQSQYSIHVLQLVMQTTGQESSEFIASTLHTAAPWLALAVVAMCWLLAWGVHWIHNTYSPDWGKRIWRVMVFAMVIWSGTREIPQYVRIGRSFSEHTTTLLGDSQHMPRLSSCYVRFFYSIAFNYVSAKELDLLVDVVAQTTVNSCSNNCPAIVLILGESFSKYHTPLYNPESLPVSPYLTALERSGNLYLHQDAVSCSNLTSVVMKNIFSTWNDDDEDSDIHHTLFPAVFRKAGYKVFFISNQFCANTGDIWNTIGGTIFNHPTLNQLQFDFRNTCLYPYDGDLLQAMPSVASLTAQPSLLIFHVMGQHVKYEERYPASFECFKPDMVTTKFGGQHAREIAAHYANATLYNDSVIGALWNQLKDQDVIAIYLSDHGEELFDWRNFYERSDISHLNKCVAKYQLDIPMMFMVSDLFKANHPDEMAAIEQCLDQPFISSNLFHLLFHLAGINHIDYEAKRDLLSPNYDPTLPRIVGNGVNYDQLD
ncbi:MAG: phosphoethanolamine transferase [Paludibacteraceae bacterium]|nr:phosphoethanolamine transferase [Paludibacteraceae bacterium]